MKCTHFRQFSYGKVEGAHKVIHFKLCHWEFHCGGMHGGRESTANILHEWDLLIVVCVFAAQAIFD